MYVKCSSIPIKNFYAHRHFLLASVIYSVERYVLVFSEVVNEFMEGLAPDFDVTQLVTGERDYVRIEILSSQGLLAGRRYNVTINAFNSAGSSASFFKFPFH